MNSKEKISIVILVILVVVTVIAVVLKERTVKTEIQKSTVEVISLPSVSASSDEIKKFVADISKNAGNASIVSISESCTPDIRVVKILPDQKITFFNAGNTVKEISIGTTTFSLAPNTVVPFAFEQVFGSNFKLSNGSVTKGYSCKGQSGPVGYIMTSATIEQ